MSSLMLWPTSVRSRILYKSSEIYREIRKLFSRKNAARRRVIIAAYVGKDAPNFLEYAKGIELYCWPLAGATNPDAIDALDQAGVAVHFALGLHSKVYWVKGRGGIVTSANLSANALTRGIQREAGVLVQMDEAEINRIIADVRAEPLTDSALAKLRREHEAFWARHGPGSEKLRASTDFIRGLTFGQWYAGSTRRRVRWKLCVATERGYALQPAAKEEAQRRTGREDYFDYLTGFKDQYAADDWILYVHEPRRSGIICEWLRVDFYVSVGADRRRSNCRYQAVQLKETSAEVSTPFQLDGPFRKAIKRTLESRPNDRDNVNPSRPFLNELHQKYLEAFRSGAERAASEDVTSDR
jgi:hypothetical protein